MTDYNASWCGSLSLSCVEFTEFLRYLHLCLSCNLRSFQQLYLQIIFQLLSLPLPFGTPTIYRLVHFMISQRSLFFSNLFFFNSSDLIISIVLSSKVCWFFFLPAYESHQQMFHFSYRTFQFQNYFLIPFYFLSLHWYFHFVHTFSWFCPFIVALWASLRQLF